MSTTDDDTVSEASDLREANRVLAESLRFHRALIAATPDAVHVQDLATGTVERALRPGPPLHGFPSEAVSVMSGAAVDEFVPQPDREQLRAAFAAAPDLADTEFASVTHRVTCGDGSTSWLRRRISVLTRDDAGAATMLVIVSTEVSERVSLEQRLRFAADFDELTGLPNSRTFVAALQTRAAAGRRPAVVVLNLDGFKPINDLHGRGAGDTTLSVVARRLRSALRADDVVARIGGDEFGLLIETDVESTARGGSADVGTELYVDRIVRRVLALVAEPFPLNGTDVTVSASAGICLFSEERQAEHMITAASTAMDRAKRASAGSHKVFDRTLEAESRMLEHIERTLRRALREQTLEVFYQPIVSPTTGRVESVEALVRLRDETGELLPAPLVIEVAERCALVAELDDQVLRTACRQVSQWRSTPEHAHLRLTLNRSARDLNRPGFHQRIMRRVAASQLPPEALTIEITETVLLDVASDRSREMRRLRDSSIGLAIDDFGTGYASMSQLINLPISALKIDRSFTSRMLDDPTCAALVRASVSIASDLGLTCVVEGVETLAQFVALPGYDRLLVQGYLFGRPRPAAVGLAVAEVQGLAAGA